MNERERFEKAYEKLNVFTTATCSKWWNDETQRYDHARIEADWQLWQAAQADWIPVSEGLPEYSGNYFVTTEDGSVEEDYWLGTMWRHNEVFVTAWRERPAPYGGEK